MADVPPETRPGRPLLVVLALAAAVGVAFTAVVLVTGLSADGVEDFVDSLGAGGPFAFIVVAALLACALFPGPLLAGASGALFGTALGTPVSIASATLGAVLAFTIARRVARASVESMVGERLPGLRDWLERNGFLAVLYARIAPGLPYTIVNYTAGLTRIRLTSFTAATAIGTSPRAFAYTALGGHLGDLRSPEALVAIGLLVAMAVAGLLLARQRANLNRYSAGSSFGRARGRQPSGQGEGREQPTTGGGAG